MIKGWFVEVLNMSLTASLVIIAVLIIRIILRKMPKIFSYVLWVVVLFRLLCPVSFSANFSMLGFLHIPSEEKGKIEYIKEDIIFQVQSDQRSDEANDKDVIEPTLKKKVDVTKESFLSIINISGWIWMGGIVSLILYSMIRIWKLKRNLKPAIWETENIYSMKGIISPFVIGVFRPRTYLPSILKQEEKEYILLHEQTHIKRGDHIIKIISFFVVCLHWFNPLVWIAFFFSGRDQEMSCDEAVLRKLGNGVKKQYSMSLLNMATGRKMINGLPLAFGEGDTKSRIKNVLNYRKPAFFLIAILLILSIIVGIFLLANPVVKKNPPVREIQQVYYGVIQDIEVDGSSIVFIPRIGRVRIPKEVKTFFYFEEQTVELERGDLAKINFAKSQELFIRESDPATFSVEPENMIIIARGMSIEYEREEWYEFSFPLGILQATSKDIKPDDILEIYRMSEDGNSEILLTESKVVAVSEKENSISIKLSLNDLEEVLMGYGFTIFFQLSQKTNMNHQNKNLEAEIVIRSISKNDRCIDQYFLEGESQDIDESDPILTFAEDCVFKVNYKMSGIEYEEVTFDFFADLIEECVPDVNCPCTLTIKDNLIVEIKNKNGYLNYGIRPSLALGVDSWYKLIIEKMGANALEEYYKQVFTKEVDIADVIGNEKIEVYIGNIGDGESGIFMVKDANDNLLFTDSAHISRAGWNNIYLGNIEGINFIMRLHIEDRDTYGGYDYQVFRLSEKGEVEHIAGSSFEFGVSYKYQDDLFKEWVEEMNYYLEKSSLILSTQDAIVRINAGSESNLYTYTTLRRKES